jgi:hypothetical protein
MRPRTEREVARFTTTKSAGNWKSTARSKTRLISEDYEQRAGRNRLVRSFYRREFEIGVVEIGRPTNSLFGQIRSLFRRFQSLLCCAGNLVDFAKATAAHTRLEIRNTGDIAKNSL